jgi:hypothetical protein
MISVCNKLETVSGGGSNDICCPDFPLNQPGGLFLLDMEISIPFKICEPTSSFDKGCFTNSTEGLKPSKNFL